MARFFIPSTLLLALYLGLSFAGEDWKGELLNAENQHRNVHGVEPLHYNDELAQQAQQWAEHLAEQCIPMNNHNVHAGYDDPRLMYHGEISGENINRGEITGDVSEDEIQQWAESSAGNSAEPWYKEIEDYPFGDFHSDQNPNLKVYHFTQMVWKSTKEVGYGLARCGKKYYLVARYFPKGNMEIMGGHNFEENVLPPQ